MNFSPGIFMGLSRITLLTEKKPFAILFNAASHLVFTQINAAPLKLTDTYKGQKTPQKSIYLSFFLL